MRILIAEDDFASRRVILKFLSVYGECDVTVDGMEAIDAFQMALDENEPYDLICLDIMMPIMDGYQALKNIRDIEKEQNIPDEKKVKVIMTTALNEEKNLKRAYELGCTVYCTKPIDMDKLKATLEELGLI
jgi:two-component system chemotaxis response regulator CheY